MEMMTPERNARAPRVSHWLHPYAEAELGEAAVYHAQHASLAIAEAFLAEHERVRDLIIENPQRGPHAEGGLRSTTLNALRTR
jgi:plasmid stabilization system protein ParE